LPSTKLGRNYFGNRFDELQRGTGITKRDDAESATLPAGRLNDEHQHSGRQHRARSHGAASIQPASQNLPQSFAASTDLEHVLGGIAAEH
jgi:hypothetical protein